MVAPRWGGEVNYLGGREETIQKGASNSESSCSGKRLGSCDLLGGDPGLAYRPNRNPENKAHGTGF